MHCVMILLRHKVCVIYRGRSMKKLKKAGFKSQILFFLIIAGTIGILMIGGAVYFLEVHQVKKNISCQKVMLRKFLTEKNRVQFMK